VRYKRRAPLKIQINTDGNIEGDERLAAHVKRTVESALRRNIDYVTRVEVHLSDVNRHKTGYDDKRCMMEARLKGRHPIVVTDRAATLDKAVDGAAEKLTALVESTLGRMRQQRNRRTDPPPPPEPTL
jgi:ribosome-associated translation inhibitor RaiA